MFNVYGEIVKVASIVNNRYVEHWHGNADINAINILSRSGETYNSKVNDLTIVE